MNSVALSIWNDISKTSTDQINIHYEGKHIVGMDLYTDQDAIDYIEILIRRLEVYKEKLEDHYGRVKPKSKKIDKMISLKQSYIYLMKNYRNGYYKIGRSLNPEYRERTLQAEAPEIGLEFVSPLTPSILEGKLHNFFKEKRIRGEWFSLSEKDVEYIKSYKYDT